MSLLNFYTSLPALLSIFNSLPTFKNPPVLPGLLYHFCFSQNSILQHMKYLLLFHAACWLPCLRRMQLYFPPPFLYLKLFIETKGMMWAGFGRGLQGSNSTSFTYTITVKFLKPQGNMGYQMYGGCYPLMTCSKSLG